MKKNIYLCTRNSKKDAPVAQLVEHLTLNQGVQGSSPCGCTFEKQKRDAPVAQLVEHLTLNQGVQGSSPCGCTKKQTLKVCFFLQCLRRSRRDSLAALKQARLFQI